MCQRFPCGSKCFLFSPLTVKLPLSVIVQLVSIPRILHSEASGEILLSLVLAFLFPLPVFLGFAKLLLLLSFLLLNPAERLLLLRPFFGFLHTSPGLFALFFFSSSSHSRRSFFLSSTLRSSPVSSSSSGSLLLARDDDPLLW